MCSTSLVAKHLSFSITYVSSTRNLKNLLLRSLFSDHANFGDFTLLFCRARLRNVHTFKTKTCWAIDLSVRIFFLSSPRCRGLLKVPNYGGTCITQHRIMRSTWIKRSVAKVISFFLLNHYNFCFIKQSPLLSGRSQALLSLEGLFVFSSTCTERSLKAESLNWNHVIDLLT